jgi:hypothetical protein
MEELRDAGEPLLVAAGPHNESHLASEPLTGTYTGWQPHWAVLGPGEECRESVVVEDSPGAADPHYDPVDADSLAAEEVQWPHLHDPTHPLYQIRMDPMPGVVKCGWCGRRVPHWSPFDRFLRSTEESLGYYLCGAHPDEGYSCIVRHRWRGRRRADYFYLSLGGVFCSRRVIHPDAWNARRPDCDDPTTVLGLLCYIAPFL